VQWSLGIGVISAPRPYVGADNQTTLVPLVNLEYKRFSFRGIQASYRVVQNGTFTLEIFGRPEFGGYEEDDSSFLAGMEDRRETAEMGLSASWALGPFELETSAAADVLGRSDGVQASLELTWNKIFGRGEAGLFPGVGVVWQSADYVDYYAGVEPREARPGRPPYEGRSALNVGAGLRAFSKVTRRLQLIGLLRVQRLAGEYEKSPIIEERWTYFGLLGVAVSR
jgi:outer membrane protein